MICKQPILLPFLPPSWHYMENALTNILIKSRQSLFPLGLRFHFPSSSLTSSRKLFLYTIISTHQQQQQSLHRLRQTPIWWGKSVYQKLHIVICSSCPDNLFKINKEMKLWKTKNIKENEVQFPFFKKKEYTKLNG